MVIRVLKKYYALVGAILCAILFLAFYAQVYSSSYQGAADSFEASFHDREDELASGLAYFKNDLVASGIDKVWTDAENPSDINLHVYRHDSLVYWNTNQLPIIRFAEIHFPSEGLLHLQNGWYYAKIIEVDEFLICGSFLIKQDYSYENNDLVNEFSEQLPLSFGASISLDEYEGYPVQLANQEFVFSLLPDELQAATSSESILLLILLLVTISMWLLWLSQVRVRLPKKLQWFVPLAVIIVRILSIYYNWFAFMGETAAFDPSLYGANAWFPNFAEYLINIAVIVYLMTELKVLIKIVVKNAFGRWIALLTYVGSIFLWIFLVYLIQGLIEHSSIPLIIDKLFALNVFSLLAVASIGIFFYSYSLLLRSLVMCCKELKWSATQLAVITFILGCLFLLYEINIGDQVLLNGLFPMVFYGLIMYLVYRYANVRKLGAGLILLMLFSLVISVNISEFNRVKERGERELYANQVATEQDIVTEAEYALLAGKIQTDKFLQRFIAAPQVMSFSEFQEGMERRLFNGFWERYEMTFSLFDEEHQALIQYSKDPGDLYDELQTIVERSGVPSEIDDNMYFIEDHSGQFSYIIRQTLIAKDSSNTATLFCTLKSKKIPEEIGFPRLLISVQTNVLETLEGYSIAKYHKGRLVTKYGEFNYPSSHTAMVPKKIKSKGFFDYDKYNHYVLMEDKSDVVVLSSKNFSNIDLLTSFSYLFSFFGMLLLPLIFRLNSGGAIRRTFSLAMKIQFVLISLVFLSLLAFGWGSGIFVSDQYNQYTNDVISEKLNSVQTEVRSKLGDLDGLTIEENGNYMQFIFQKFAKVFYTDINMYDNDGHLLGTSRPKVYNIGLLSEQMNPIAYEFMHYNQKSEFVHAESIGELNYSSAYLPFYNNNGVLMGFINLQHFGQQREFENQIQKFLVAIINVFILLLAISIVLAIFISNWLTSPLRILQESFARVKFGKHNEQISYDREDEIGALVKDYNQKLLELEFAAEQLAKSERESAWREMAKQVAHEIKNPLTPMKLSVQQLLRTYDPNDPKSGDKLKKVANSIVEQIDALTNIANEFASFAKMPNPREERFDLVALVRGVREVFTTEARIKLIIVCDPDVIHVKADKDQFVRVFNNLIKNAIQAIPSDRSGIIDIDLRTKGNKVHVKVTDNGVGIDPSKEGKIFVPYFTTKSTGTGLGLAMVKQIIENHQGSIDFDTTLDVGTTFELILPITL
ncbi:MAG: two-component system nitrogen regulation sensor histidine kinase NtrY [Crocinitomicaceae bacterium]|jgi:two-component system nitrogen regulation sensor histidine kinase NtrY